MTSLRRLEEKRLKGQCRSDVGKTVYRLLALDLVKQMKWMIILGDLSVTWALICPIASMLGGWYFYVGIMEASK